MAVQPSESSGPILTIIVFGIISSLIYVFLLKPFFQQGQPQPHAGTPRQGQRQARVPTAALTTQSVFPSTRKPPHATNTNALLVDGLVSFRHSVASKYDLDPDSKKERAKLVSQILMLLGSTAPPPPRGTVIVVSIHSADVGCKELKRILFLLATYFNLLVVLCVDNNNVKNDDVVERMKQQLALEVLPSHRIVAASSVTGRVALVRQLTAVEFVLDHDEAVEKELSRFGFTVLTYGSERKGGMSMLATHLFKEGESKS